MNDAIIGSTGFVGTNLCAAHDFSARFHSRNIAEIDGTRFDSVVCAAAPATMWAANQDPDGDLRNIQGLLSHLERMHADHFVLISTIAVLAQPDGLDEATDRFEATKAYGRNRRLLEEACLARFPRTYILRLPALFGRGLKKNLIFDILNPAPSFLKPDKYDELVGQLDGRAAANLQRVYTYAEEFKMYRCERDRLVGGDREALIRALKAVGFTAANFTNADSTFQFYALADLWSDIDVAKKNGLQVMHLAPEPLRAGDVFRELTGEDFDVRTATVYHEDMRTIHAKLWHQPKSYIRDRTSVLTGLKAFCQQSVQL